MATVLLHSAAPWCGTGYGQQCAQLARRLRDAGHTVEISAHYGLEGTINVWEGIRVWPGANDTGRRMLPQYIDALNPDLILTLQDVHALPADKLKGKPVASWIPVDHQPLGCQITEYLKESDAIPIGMSRHGERMLQDAGHQPLYAPHAIDTTVFTPQPRDEARHSIEMPQSAFLVLVVGANMDQAPSRKGWVEAIRAFKTFRERHDDARLWMHTSLDGRYGGGEGLSMPYLCEAVGIPVPPDPAAEEWLAGTPKFRYEMGLTPEQMATLYSAADVLLAPSYGEGFGLPVLEAQACGTPVITSNYTAQPELCGAGWMVGGRPYWIDPYRAWWQAPDVDEIVEALELAYVDADGMSDQAVEFASAYDADLVYEEHWSPVLDRLTGGSVPVQAQLNRAQRRAQARAKVAV